MIHGMTHEEYEDLLHLEPEKVHESLMSAIDHFIATNTDEKRRQFWEEKAKREMAMKARSAAIQAEIEEALAERYSQPFGQLPVFGT
jgi:hypothetical protein